MKLARQRPPPIHGMPPTRLRYQQQRLGARSPSLSRPSYNREPGDLSTIGVGTLKADDALDVPVNSTIPQTPPDTIDFALLKILFGWDGIAPARQNMLSVEAAQLVASSSKLSALMGDAAQNPDRMSADEKKSAVEALINAAGISDTLKRFLQNARAKM